jgi:UMP-CMP kinase
MRRLGTLARQLGASEGGRSAPGVASLVQQSQQQHEFWKLGVGLAAAAAATAAAPPLSAQCTPSIEKPIKLPDLSTGGISLRGSTTPSKTQRSIVFVLGGPGSGKGTQCAKLVEEFGIVHLSAGDLLRAHMKSGSPDGNMVADMIKDGKIVPSHVTNGLLENAMTNSGRDKFLIDGFPRNDENRAAFEADTGEEPAFVLFFSCPEEVMEKRLLGRNEGRTDDNIETIRKRFKVFVDSTMPIIEHYKGRGKVREIDATRSPDEVYQDVRPLFVDL